MSQKLVVIRNQEQLNDLTNAIQNVEYISFDTETTGLDKDATIIGYSVATDEYTSYYVVINAWDAQVQTLVDLETRAGSKTFLLKLLGKKLVMHNATFDCIMVQNNFGIDLMPSVFCDTMILAQLLDENRSAGLKELGTYFYGETAAEEQAAMKASVLANGGQLTKENYELYKADSELIALYGAKDTILTYKLFLELIPNLYEQGLEDFFFKDESMPLLKGPTYDLNTSGIRIDPNALQKLKGELQASCMEDEIYIYNEIFPHVKEKYPATGKTNKFNIGASQQRAWLLFVALGEDFHLLTKEGKKICKYLDLRLPYAHKDKLAFIDACLKHKNEVYGRSDNKSKKGTYPEKKISENYWKYMASGKGTFATFSKKYKWVEKLLEYSKNMKLLSTYVEGIESRMRYNVIQPSFLQHGTTSGRYGCRNPNFQNLPRDDKRVKACIVSRPGKVFVGADYEQLEPRVFASLSGDTRLLKGFEDGDDFYSVVGAPVFDKLGINLKKGHPESFSVLYPELRDISKVIALSTPYGTSKSEMARRLDKPVDEAAEIISKYFEDYPSVHKLMLDSHKEAMTNGQTVSMFGRPRRLPIALDFKKIYGNVNHAELPYEARNVLNLAMNHRIQSTGASIVNRASIAFWNMVQMLRVDDPIWDAVKIVLQVHDELIVECPEELQEEVGILLKDAMENTSELPGVALVAHPKVAKKLSELK